MKNLLQNAQRGKWFTFVLYPDCNAHRDILNYILDDKIQEVQKFTTAGILHDRDFYSEGVKKGLPKKPHIHVIMNTENKHTATAIAKMMGGQHTVLRLYQRDEKHEHSTTLSMPDKKKKKAKGQPNDDEADQEQLELEIDDQIKEDEKTKKGITRHFHHVTGDEYPVLVDTGHGEPQPIDVEITPEIWAVIESKDRHHWDSLPQRFYNNSDYPQFKCADNQYWKLVTRQDLSHAEVIADPLAYYLYLQHKDIASLRNHKAPYEEHEFFGNQELLAKLRGERGLRYQISQVVEYFNNCGVTNGKDALQALLYGDCTEELLKFYWSNTSKFTAYFRGLELEAKEHNKEDELSVDDIPTDNIDYAHKNARERKEAYDEWNKATAKSYAQQYEEMIQVGKMTGSLDEAQQAKLKEIANWFSTHPDYKLFNYAPYEEQLFNHQLYNSIMGQFKKQEQEQEQEESQEETSDYYQAPLPTEEENDDYVNWDEWTPEPHWWEG